MELKQLLRKKREKEGLTQKEAAKLFGVSQLTWTSWERGQIPSIAHLFRIADWIACKLDDLRVHIPGCSPEETQPKKSTEENG